MIFPPWPLRVCYNFRGGLQAWEVIRPSPKPDSSESNTEIEIAQELLRENDIFLPTLKEKRRARCFPESRPCWLQPSWVRGLGPGSVKPQCQMSGLSTLGFLGRCSQDQVHDSPRELISARLFEMKGWCLLKTCFQKFPTSVQFSPQGMTRKKKPHSNCSVVQNLRAWSEIAEADTLNSQEPPFPFHGHLLASYEDIGFLYQNQNVCSVPLACSAVKYEKLEHSTQFSINLPGCNNQDGFQLKPYLYFLFISWNVRRHIHSLLFSFPEYFIKTSPLVICYLLPFQRVANKSVSLPSKE